MITKTRFLNEDAYQLENEQVRAVVLPARGGKVASFYHKQKGFELLFQNPNNLYKPASLYSRFEEFEACGFDDAFPSIDEGLVSLGMHIVHYPDHGEIWSAGFEAEVCGDTLSLQYNGRVFNYAYRKSFMLSENRLVCRYSIENRSLAAFPYIWAFHCLVNYEPEMQLLFPQGTVQMENVTHSARLGEKGRCYAFPADTAADGNTYDFTRVPPVQPSSCEKYYVKGKTAEGHCGYYYHSKELTALIEYDPVKLPYLGFWVTAGAFRGDYNCALEPCTGYYDSIDTAQKNGAQSFLLPGEVFSFNMSISLN
jgi:galactose mutarotase-like enzyme